MAATGLETFDHMVVLMLENRSFDQMLGFLELEGHDVDGVKPREGKRLANQSGGTAYECRPIKRTTLTKAEDPCHDGWCVAEQLRGGNSGFVENFTATNPAADPGVVMGHYTARELPVYHFLASEFAVCDRWFCSTLGATWPNRLYALTGAAAGRFDNEMPPIYDRASFMRQLDEANRLTGGRGPTWRWYSSDPATLRFIDHSYFLEMSDRFAYFDKPTVLQQRTFLKDAAAGDLPSVAWIDPNFVDLGGPGGANDDHPPADVMAGQELVLKVYTALAAGPAWTRTLLLVVYDEHGGFFDHVPPGEHLPAGGLTDVDPRFRRYGPRVPALVVSPHVKARNHCHDVFDHTSIIKTALLRFCGERAWDAIEAMGPRVAQARDLGALLTEPDPRAAPDPDPARVVDPLVERGAREIRRRLLHPLAEAAPMHGVEPVGSIRRLIGILRKAVGEFVAKRFGRRVTLPGARPALALELEPRHEFEASIFEGAKELRRSGVPAGHP